MRATNWISKSSDELSLSAQPTRPAALANLPTYSNRYWRNADALTSSWPKALPNCRNWLMRFPDKLDVLAVHARLIAETGGSTGIRDEGLLESALAAAENRLNYEHGDVVECAAAYA